MSTTHYWQSGTSKAIILKPLRRLCLQSRYFVALLRIFVNGTLVFYEFAVLSILFILQWLLIGISLLALGSILDCFYFSGLFWLNLLTFLYFVYD